MACPAPPDDDHYPGYSSVAVEHDEGCDEQVDVTDRLLLGLYSDDGKGRDQRWMDGWWSKEAGRRAVLLISCAIVFVYTTLFKRRI